ncbi:MAG TPA: tRNA 2-thiouridine(34) synthase MnmA [Gaiellaceae bacterium]
MRTAFGDAAIGGDWASVQLRLRGEQIVEADADGLDEKLDGLSLLEAAAVGGEPLALEALAAALGPVFRAAPDPERVAVAMSGGVDSAVALLAAGPKAIGVTLRLWTDPDGPDSEAACCSPDSVRLARATCHRLGLPHVTLDLRDEFYLAVVEPFVRSYGAGLTPNPCVRCNGTFRFGRLLAFARRAGASRLATGHYARLVERQGKLLIACARDREKDQSYMLAGLDPGLLDRLWFPLAELEKSETRERAAVAGLEVAMRPESQEACFLAGADYRDFLERRGLLSSSGEVVDESGKRLGQHDGYWRFTPGQRRGLGIASSAGPLYVLRTQAKKNLVVAGPEQALARRSVSARGKLYLPLRRAEAKLRYRSPALPAEVEPTAGGFRLHLAEPAFAVAPGQAAVLYDDEVVAGFGLITSAREN